MCSTIDIIKRVRVPVRIILLWGGGLGDPDVLYTLEYLRIERGIWGSKSSVKFGEVLTSRRCHFVLLAESNTHLTIRDGMGRTD